MRNNPKLILSWLEYFYNQKYVLGDTPGQAAAKANIAVGIQTLAEDLSGVLCAMLGVRPDHIFRALLDAPKEEVKLAINYFKNIHKFKRPHETPPGTAPCDTGRTAPDPGT